MGQVTVLSGSKRRRWWSAEEWLQIAAEALTPGARVADVCRRHDASPGLIETWQRKLRERGAAQDRKMPEALPAPVPGEAVMDDVPVAAASCAKHPALGTDLPRPSLRDDRWRRVDTDSAWLHRTEDGHTGLVQQIALSYRLQPLCGALSLLCFGSAAALGRSCASGVLGAIQLCMSCARSHFALECDTEFVMA